MNAASAPHTDCPCVCHLDALATCDSPTCEAINYYRAEEVAAFQAACEHQIVPGWGCVRCGAGRPEWLQLAETTDAPPPK